MIMAGSSMDEARPIGDGLDFSRRRGRRGVVDVFLNYEGEEMRAIIVDA